MLRRLSKVTDGYERKRVTHQRSTEANDNKWIGGDKAVTSASRRINSPFVLYCSVQHRAMHVEMQQALPKQLLSKTETADGGLLIDTQTSWPPINCTRPRVESVHCAQCCGRV